jgi:hypothetical protein
VTRIQNYLREKMRENPRMFYILGLFLLILGGYQLYDFVFPEASFEVRVIPIPGKVFQERSFSFNFADERFGRPRTGFGIFISPDETRIVKHRARFIRFNSDIDVYLHMYGPYKFEIASSYKNKICKTYSKIINTNQKTNLKITLC